MKKILFSSLIVMIMALVVTISALAIPKISVTASNETSTNETSANETASNEPSALEVKTLSDIGNATIAGTGAYYDDGMLKYAGSGNTIGYKLDQSNTVLEFDIIFDYPS